MTDLIWPTVGLIGPPLAILLITVLILAFWYPRPDEQFSDEQYEDGFYVYKEHQS